MLQPRTAFPQIFLSLVFSCAPAHRERGEMGLPSDYRRNGTPAEDEKTKTKDPKVHPLKSPAPRDAFAPTGDTTMTKTTTRFAKFVTAAAAALTLSIAAMPAAEAGPFKPFGPMGGPGPIKPIGPIKPGPIGPIFPGKPGGHHHHHGGGYLAAGLIGGALVGSAIAASGGNPGYVDGDCYRVRQRVWDDYRGRYVVIRRLVCD